MVGTGLFVVNDICYTAALGNAKISPVIYSEEEREIGVWTDGKPLYEKTIHPTSLSSGLNSINHNISNFGMLVDFKGVCTFNNQDTWLVIPYVSDSSQYYIYASNVTTSSFVIGFGGGFTAIDNCYVTLRYTKSTDTAGSGTWTPQGIPAVHYSEEEQVVGTWIDGSTIYEKTYTATMASGATSCDIAFPDIGNNGRILSLEGLFDGAIPFTLNGAISSDHFNVISLNQYALYGYITNDGIRVTRTSPAEYSASPNVAVTIRYLKSAS